MPPRKPSPAPIIAADTDIKSGVRALRRKCAVMRAVHDVAGDPPLRRNPGGFYGLARSVVFQQVSVASGTAIWSRVEAGVRPFEAAVLLSQDDEALRGYGLSRPKLRTLRAVAEAVDTGRMCFDALAELPDADAHAQLVALHGIGPWTADIYLMFSLGRPDAFAAGDLALQEAVRLAMQLEDRPTHRELEAIAERWRPWRSVAARLLWAYYAVAKQGRSGAPV